MLPQTEPCAEQGIEDARVTGGRKQPLGARAQRARGEQGLSGGRSAPCPSQGFGKPTFTCFTHLGKRHEPVHTVNRLRLHTRPPRLRVPTQLLKFQLQDTFSSPSTNHL